MAHFTVKHLTDAEVAELRVLLAEWRAHKAGPGISAVPPDEPPASVPANVDPVPPPSSSPPV
jgi:hypothetical protein